MTGRNFNPLVDIIIITYNQEKYIDETIASAINQTYTNTRLIIADDCSTDNTRKIIEKWASKHPDKITSVFSETNLGITGNSNIALRKSRGDYFIILGGDDLLYPERIEAQINWFMEHPQAVLCGHEIDYIDANSSIIRQYKQTKNRTGKGNISWIVYGMLYGTISIMYKKSHFPTLEYDKRLPQVSDLKFCIDFLGNEGIYGFLNLRLSGYRKTEHSFTTLHWQRSLKDQNEMFEILKRESPVKLLPQIKKGQNYLVKYSRGMVYLNEGKYRNSVLSFMKVISMDITNWKAFLRIFQVVYKAIFS